MDRNKVSQYLKDFQENEVPKTIERTLKVPDTQRIVSIIGPRRCGKTFYFFQIMNKLINAGVKKSQIIYLNFEDVRLSELKYTEIQDAIKLHWELYPESIKTRLHLFFDEPQNIQLWEKAIRSIHDSKIGRIFVTGSSAKLLSKEISTSLRGRTLPYTLLPFSFKEFTAFKELKYDKTLQLSSKEEATIKSALKEYIRSGGFPEVIETKDENVRLRILREYFDLVTYRDIIERHRIKNIHIVKTMLNHLFSLFSKELSVHAFFNTLKSQGIKISKKTAYNYLNYIEDSLAIFLLRKFSYSLKTRELSMPKVFLTDTGLANLFVGFSENLGRIIENIVFLELKRKQNINPLIEIYYWKDTASECDFVIKEGPKIKTLIQTCWTIEDRKTKERELKGLISASTELKCNNLTIITWDYENTEKHKNKKIQFVPLWKWLL